MASQSFTGITNQFTVATVGIIAAAVSASTVSKVGAWEEDRAVFFKALSKNDTATTDTIIAKYPTEWTGWKSDKGSSPLYVAQENNSLETLALLLDRGANIDEEYKGGWTPILTAYKNNQPEIFSCLLERGADLDQTGMTKPPGEYSTPCYTTLLHMAVQADDKKTIIRLLEHGADPTVSVKLKLPSMIPFHTRVEYGSAAELATKQDKHLLGDLINRASVIRADFLAAAAQPAPAPVPVPPPAAPADSGKIEVMTPVQLKKPGSP